MYLSENPKESCLSHNLLKSTNSKKVGPPRFELGYQAPKAWRMDQATLRPRSFLLPLFHFISFLNTTLITETFK